MRSFYLLLASLALFLLVPSAGIVEKYLGPRGVWIYWIVSGALLLAIMRPRSLPIRLTMRISPRLAWVLMALTLAALIAAFVVIYPIANSGIIGGGSDGDEAVNLGVRELWQGRYPYYAKTYLDNPVVTLMGGLLLSTPATLLGNSVYQNFVWLALFFVTLKLRLCDIRLALLLSWLVLLLAPIVFYELMTGSDRSANALAVLVSTQWLMTTLRSRQRRVIAAAILLGLSLAWRMNFLLLLPPIALAVWHNADHRTALVILAVIAVVLLIAIVPFYLVDPAGFTPLQTGLKLILPTASVVIPLLTGVMAMVLAFRQPRPCSINRLFRSCALVLALPIWCVIVLATLLSGHVTFSFAGYGVFALYFGVATYGVDLLQRVSVKQENVERVLPTTR